MATTTTMATMTTMATRPKFQQTSGSRSKLNVFGTSILVECSLAILLTSLPVSGWLKMCISTSHLHLSSKSSNFCSLVTHISALLSRDFPSFLTAAENVNYSTFCITAINLHISASSNWQLARAANWAQWIYVHFGEPKKNENNNNLKFSVWRFFSKVKGSLVLTLTKKY